MISIASRPGPTSLVEFASRLVLPVDDKRNPEYLLEAIGMLRIGQWGPCADKSSKEIGCMSGAYASIMARATRALATVSTKWITYLWIINDDNIAFMADTFLRPTEFLPICD